MQPSNSQSLPNPANQPQVAPAAPPPAPAPAPPPTTPPPQYSTDIQAASQAQLQPTAQNLTSTTAPQMPPPPGAPQPTGPPPQALPQQKPAEPPKLTKKQQEQMNTAQSSLLISEIRENMMVMNDGSFRAVVACESINYDLMSNEERDGIEYSYQNFLNTLNFPIQVIIQSRRIDIKPYLDKLEKIRGEQENMLLGVLMDDYLDFIFDISQQANIMRKDFFVVIPYKIGGDDTNELNLKALKDNAIAEITPKTHIKINAADYSKAKDEMKNRVSTVLSGLMNIGVRAGQLPTKALGELYYNFYNPDTALSGPIGELRQYTESLFVKKGEGEAPKPGGQ